VRAFTADPEEAESAVAALKVSSGDVAWDPHNLLSDKSPISMGRIEQRLAERRKQQQGKPANPDIPIHKVPEKEIASGGVPLAQAPGSDRGPTFAEHVGETYVQAAIEVCLAIVLLALLKAKAHRPQNFVLPLVLDSLMP
jgi:hypothetical protein